jgi:hypothetical protein
VRDGPGTGSSVHDDERVGKGEGDDGACREVEVGASWGWAGERGGLREMSRCEGFEVVVAMVRVWRGRRRGGRGGRRANEPRNEDIDGACLVLTALLLSSRQAPLPEER